MKHKASLFFRAMAVVLSVALVLTPVTVPVFAAPATPAPPRLVTDKTEVTLLIGEQSSVSIDFDSCREQIPEQWRYDYNSPYFSSADPTVITVDHNGVITAVGPGVAIANAGFAGLVGECICTVLPHYIYISATKADVCVEDAFTLSIDSDLDITKYGYRVVDRDSEEYTSDAFGVSKSGDSFTFTAEKAGLYTIEIVCKTDEGSFVRSCDVSVKEPGPDCDEDIYLAVGGTVRIPVVRSDIYSAYVTESYYAEASDSFSLTGSTGYQGYAYQNSGSAKTQIPDDTAEAFFDRRSGEDYDIRHDAELPQSGARFISADVDGVQVDIPIFFDSPIDLQTVSDYVYVTGENEGETALRILCRDGSSRITTKVIRLHVTDPVYVPETDLIENGKDYVPSFKGLAEGSSITSVSAQCITPVSGSLSGVAVYAEEEQEETEEAPIYVICTRDDDGRVVSYRPVGSGDVRLVVTADGRDYVQDAVFVDPQLTYDSITLGKQAEHPLGVTGIPDDMPVFYMSLNPSIVSVDQDGTVHSFSQKGKTAIMVFVGDKWEFKVGITVGSTKAIKALLEAEAVLGAEYSQAKRNKVGFYDCSSLIHRSFVAAGYPIASTTTYATNAPTAAEIARLQEKEGNVISYSYLPAEELQPGDLIFYQTTTNNNRYRSIGHVAFYYGPAYDPEMGGNIDTGKILHAFDSVEFYDYANFRTERIVMIARPFKN